MTGPGAEMPFLEHLEELRVRLVRVLLALLVGGVVGFLVVQQFQVVELLKEPIAPYLRVTAGKLVITSPTEAVMITLKLAVLLGLVLVSPFVIFQVWAFLSPALYQRERRVMIPALVVGLAFFLAGGAFAWLVVLPQSLPILFSFQSQGLENLITFQEYFGFVTQLVLAMGICFEIPLVIILLTALGILTPASLSRFRRFAVVLGAVAAAILSPGTDILSMLIFMVPILLLYEIGYMGSWLIHRRRLRQGAGPLIILLLLGGGAATLTAQEPAPPKPPLKRPPAGEAPISQRDSAMADTARVRPGQPLDTTSARLLGLPTAPRRPFPAEDSLMARLLERPGYQVTRFRADSAAFFADERRIELRGQASTRRGPTTLEADSIAYQEANCLLRAVGDPALFDRETILTGFGGIRYNTCIRRGVVTGALTSFRQGSTDWFLRGNLAQDSSAARLYAAEGEITSCDLPEPHYHFLASEVKWVSKSVMVARPAVLYVRDVPILWLPFVFQDTRPGRRSGILIPRFGLNDIVRQDPGYNRQVTNVGYYWAPNHYFDLVARLDWYANRFINYGAAGQYRVLNRFVTGAGSWERTVEAGGRRATTIRWDHRQNFDLSTSLNLNLHYTSSTTVRRRNAIDPSQSTQQITSAGNFSKRFGWGTMALGGSRRQSISDGSVQLQFPSLTITPKPLDLSRDVTWSPGLSISNSLESRVPLSLLQVLPGGGLDTARRNSRTSSLGFETPFRIGGFNWRNSLQLTDRQVDGPTVVGGLKVPDPTTPDPTDSITVSQVTLGDFATEVNWETGISLPTLFRGTWKVQPSVQIVNATTGPFLLRNRNTGGDWVRQGKRFSYGASASPTFFGFFPGLGPLERIRHSVSPTLTWSYSPSAAVDPAYASAVARPGEAPRLRSDPVQLLSLGLSQNFEGKRKAPDGDSTAAAGGRKLRLLGIQTSALQYDFEQAKQPGRNGWRTQTMTNQFQSDLLPGFNLSLTHDLWRGAAGYDTTRFDPFLQSVTASLGVDGRTVRGLLGLFGLGGGRDTTRAGGEAHSPISRDEGAGRRSSYYDDLAGQGIGAGTAGRQFRASFDYSLSRQRPSLLVPDPESRQSLRFSTSFSPTPFWSVSWASQYNITANRFESHVVRLERVLHEWRAGFNFVRNPNGNFALFVSVYLSDLPDIKFDYNQTSIER